MKGALCHWMGWVVGLLLSLFAGLFAALGPLAGPLERFSFDLVLRGAGTAMPTNAVIVYLDDATYVELQQPLNRPVVRTNHAVLLKALRRDDARLVVFDLLFHDLDPTPGADSLFLTTLRERRDVVIAMKQNAIDQGPLIIGELIQPHPTYLEAAAGVGAAVFELDGDSAVRRLPRGVETSEVHAPSLGGAALLALGQRLPKVHPWYYLNYYGPPHRLPSVRYSDVLFGRVVPGFFRGKIVFVGVRSEITRAGASGDMFVTPFTRDNRTGLSPGVSIHATEFLNLLYREWISRAPGWVMCLLLLGFAGGAGAGLTWLPPLRAALVAVVAAIGLMVTAFVVMRTQHVWFPWAVLMVPLGVGLLWAVTYNGYRAHLDKQLLRQSLSKHLSPARVNHLLRHPEALRPGGEMREVSLMFTDIAGFSKIAQRKHPEDLVRLLNGYYEEAIAAVHANEGVVMDLVGDAIFALWNAPEPQPDHASRACRTALALHAKLLKFDESNEGAPLRTRVGLHCGTVCVGNVGSTVRFDYTAIGDAVNLTARLEGLNKHLGTAILTTRDVQREVAAELTTRLVGQFRFKGFDKVVEVYELLGAVGREPDGFGEFRSALRHFQRGAWKEAEADFLRVLALRPQDGPTQFYLEQLISYGTSPPPGDWLGEVDLREK